MYLPTSAIHLTLSTLLASSLAAPTTLSNTNTPDLENRNALFKRTLDGLVITYPSDDPSLHKRTWPLWGHGSGNGGCDATSGSGSGSGGAGAGAGAGAGGAASGGGSAMICISGDLAGRLTGGGSAGAGADAGTGAGGNTNATSPSYGRSSELQSRAKGDGSAGAGAGAGA